MVTPPDDPAEDAIGLLRATLDELRREVEALRALLVASVASEGRREMTLRGQGRCPACGASDLLRARRVLDRGESDTRNDMAVVRPGWWSGKVQGKFEIFVCRACGVCEWYVQKPASVEADAEDLIIRTGAPPGAGPMR